MKKILLFILVVILIYIWKLEGNSFFFTGFFVVLLFGSLRVADLSFERYSETRTILRALLDAYPNGEKFLRLYGLTDNWWFTDYPCYAYDDDILSQYFQEYFPKLVAWGRKLLYLFFLLTFLFGPCCVVMVLLSSVCDDFRNCRFYESFSSVGFLVLGGGWGVLMILFCIYWMFSSLLTSIRLMGKINNLQRVLYQLSLEILKHGSE